MRSIIFIIFEIFNIFSKYKNPLKVCLIICLDLFLNIFRALLSNTFFRCWWDGLKCAWGENKRLDNTQRFRSHSVCENSIPAARERFIMHSLADTSLLHYPNMNGRISKIGSRFARRLEEKGLETTQKNSNRARAGGGPSLCWVCNPGFCKWPSRNALAKRITARVCLRQ